MQSDKWAAINENMGLTVVETAGSFFIKKKIFGPYYYLYSPRSPEEFDPGLYADVREAGLIFLRIEPLHLIAENRSLVKTINLQPAKTLVLDLNKDLEDLKNQFHSKTRYNIRLAEKKGIKVAVAGPEQEEIFIELMKQTAERDAFRAHPATYYRGLINSDSDFIKLVIAWQGELPVAAGIFAFYDETVTYLHGASNYKFRQLMAPYLLHYRMINLAKSQGYKYYDFFGIDAKKWPGVTRFKTGFGGIEVDFPGTYDYILNKPMYFVYKVLRKIRRLKN